MPIDLETDELYPLRNAVQFARVSTLRGHAPPPRREAECEVDLELSKLLEHSRQSVTLNQGSLQDRPNILSVTT